MTAILRIESKKRLRGSVILVGVFGLLSMLYFSMFPGFQEEASEIAEAFPEFFTIMFDIEALDTIEGFIAAEIYSFFWVVLLGIYFAYISAGMISKDIASRRMDLLLSNPVTRESVLFQKVASLWVPLVILNVSVPIIVYIGGAAIGEWFNPVSLAMLHLLSIPYLLVCAGIGIFVSTMYSRPRTAQMLSLGAVLVLWIIDGIASFSDDLDWVRYVTPSRYYSETDILVHDSYALGDAGILLIAFGVLLAGAIVNFNRRDI